MPPKERWREKEKKRGCISRVSELCAFPRSGDRWIGRVHFLASIVVSTPFIGVPVGPHTVIPTEGSTFEKRAHLYLGREKEREKRRETRRESKWRARSFPPSPSFPPSDRTNDLPPSTPLPNFQPTIPFSRFSSNETPDDFPPRLIRSKRERETKRKRKVGREGDIIWQGLTRETRKRDPTLGRRIEIGSQFPDSRPRRAP